MKYNGNTTVLVPWFDAEGMKQWSRLTFRGTMDRKFLFKKIVHWVMAEFNKKVDRLWVQQQCVILNEFDKMIDLPEAAQGTFDEAVEAWIKRMETEADENEDQPDTILSGEDNTVSEQPLSDLSHSD